MPNNGRAALQSGLQALVKQGLPGVFIYIDDPDGAGGFLTAGVADIETGRQMAPGDHYRIGSTTKTFTAVVILQLVSEGRLALDDFASQWVDGLPESHRDTLTIEHLLRMRSGLFDFEDDPSLLGNLDAHLVPVTLAQVLQFGLGGATQFQPGERFAYCNTNYCVLERVVERVTGHTLGRELGERIFGPLGLTETSYPAEDDLSLPEPYIRGYQWDGSDWRECSHIFFGRGDGAIVSTAPDVTRFFRALLGGDLLPDELLERMMAIVADESATEFYGMGLIVEELPSGMVWGHAGGGFGYIHQPYLNLATGRFVICMLNGTYGFREGETGPRKQPRFSPDLRALAYTAGLHGQQ